MKPSRRRLCLRVLEWGVAGLVLVFLGLYLARNWAQVSSYPWSIEWPRMLLASGCLILAYSGFVVLWRLILSSLGGDLSLIDAHRIWYFGNLGRYVPGKVVQITGTAYMARAKGVAPVATVAASVTAQLFVLAGGLAVAAVAAPIAAYAAMGDIRYLGVLFLLGFLIIMFTPVFGWLHRSALRMVDQVDDHIEISWGHRVGWLLAYAGVWVVLGSGFYLFVTSVSAIPSGAFWPLVGICATGYVAGYLAILVPGGLGVREGVYAALLTFYLPGSVAVAVSLLARLWMTTSEVAVAGGLMARFGLGDLKGGV